MLLEKLNLYEVRSKQNDWFRSFPSNRVQHNSVNGFYSQTEIVKCSVPQGSTLDHYYFYLNK